ncbi:MAG: DUF1385 domain-containing protein [Anaerolineaceae bacterium]|nr:DUF1385 domain-containing protein [Anaerolineaceae bacterium]
MEKLRMPSYGGQALLEGILMRGQNHVAAAFRLPDGNIDIVSEELSGIYNSKIRKIPFLRGLIVLWDALVLGTRFLTISANAQTGEDEKIEGPTLYITLLASLVLAILLFFIAPAALGQWLGKLLDWSAWVSNIAEGTVRLIFTLVYISVIGKVPEIDRVFAYHGAEHKTINAFEAGENLTPQNVQPYSVEHPRCGTAFLLTLVLISLVFFSALGPLSWFWRLATRIIFLPLLACISYEYIRWTGNHLDSKIVRFMIRPNLALQRLVTREPSPEMLEISIAAFNTMYALENPD